MKAQKWLDEKYPKKEKRNTIKKLNIINKDLEGMLKLDDFNNLEKLNCSDNLITGLDLSSCNAEKLIELNVSNNDFDSQDLTFVSRFTNLEKLYLGTTIPERIQQSTYNRFTCSLELLKDLTKLKELSISNTNIDSGLEYLPESLEKLYCFNYPSDSDNCKDILKELEGCLSKNEQYYDLQTWRRNQRRLQKTDKEGSIDFVPPSLVEDVVKEQRVKVQAQKWLDKNYTKNERKRCIKLNISYRKLEQILEGPLDLTDFRDLRELDCSEQKITELKIGNFSQLEEFYCNNNNLTNLAIKKCPKLTKIDCSKNQLTSLTVIKCPQLAEFYCSDNNLTKLDFSKLSKEKLTNLRLHNNNFSPLNLSVLTPFVNLEQIIIGNDNDDGEKINKGFYNHFYGSLESLKNMTKLRYLDIKATDIDEGLNYLPKSLSPENFLHTSHGSCAKVSRIEEILKGKIKPSLSQQPSISFRNYFLSSGAVDSLEIREPNVTTPISNSLQRRRRNDNLVVTQRVNSINESTEPLILNSTGDSVNISHNTHDYTTTMEERNEEEIPLKGSIEIKITD